MPQKIDKDFVVFSLHTLHESTTYPQQPNQITERDGPGNRGEPKGSCPLEHTKENAKQWPCKDNMQATTHTMYRIYTREEKTCIQFGSPSRHRFRAIAVRHVWKLETEAQSTTVCGKPLYTYTMPNTDRECKECWSLTSSMWPYNCLVCSPGRSEPKTSA